ncbi:hypothetical protein FHW69_001717 [Luteibacter sp. Sphag1AF]|uniref:hypothetical protein n=1 Tax=Luteibacter sp. Sphag1AF TaxID=2587031 RepID=UPI00161B8E53|nr:hypothetical protein [Luteibacter sp. Sphag1AF]MBB3227116.1 hypothetical protein [Luteibacter sp. Sphag1AF]
MTRRITCALALLLALTTTAFGSTMKKPDIKKNPQPRMRYDITVTVDGAPATFDRVEGSVDYVVKNEECVPLTPIAGARVRPEERVPLELTHAGGNVYRGVIYADQFVDEDYFGRGVCHWGIVGAAARLKANQVTISAALYGNDILASGSNTRYYANRTFQVPMELLDNGEPARANFKEPGQTFSVTLKAEERTP